MLTDDYCSVVNTNNNNDQILMVFTITNDYNKS